MVDDEEIHSRFQFNGWQHKLTINSESIKDLMDTEQPTIGWADVKWLESNDKYIFMRMNNQIFFIVPRRAFANDTTYSRFIETAKGYKLTAKMV